MLWRTLLLVAALAGGLQNMTGAGAQVSLDDPNQIPIGRTVFENACAGCHGPGGMGSDRGRVLTDIAVEQPDRTVHLESVRTGKDKMPAFGGVLAEEEIDAVVSFVRLTFVSESDANLAATGGDVSGSLVIAVVLILSGLLCCRVRRGEP